MLEAELKKMVDEAVADALKKDELDDLSVRRHHKTMMTWLIRTTRGILIFLFAAFGFFLWQHWRIEVNLDSVQPCRQESTMPTGGEWPVSVQQMNGSVVNASAQSNHWGAFAQTYDLLRSEQSEWLTIIGIIIAFFGVAVPIGAQLAQSKTMETAMDQVRKDFKSESKKFGEEVAEFDKKIAAFEAKSKEFEKKIAAFEAWIKDAGKQANGIESATQKNLTDEKTETRKKQAANTMGNQADAIVNFQTKESNSSELRYHHNLLRDLGSPIVAFKYALQNRDIGFAVYLLPKLKNAMPKETYLFKVLTPVACMGSEVAGRELKQILQGFSSSDCPYSLGVKVDAIGSYVTYCNKRDIEIEEMKFVQGLINDTLPQADDDDKQKAQLYNQRQRLLYGAADGWEKKHEKDKAIICLNDAIVAIDHAIGLDAEEPSYEYNRAGCYKELGDMDGAIESIDLCMAKAASRHSERDYDHVHMAYALHKERGTDEDMKQCNEYATLMRKINPARAEMDIDFA